MAKNDVVLLDGIVEQRLMERLPSNEPDEVFECFVLEQVLKDYDLSSDEIELGRTDGRNDGGIDGFYILINGHILDDANNFQWPKSNALIEIWLFTCKHHSTFAQATLDAIIATINELFDLGLKNGELAGSYSKEILYSRGLFQAAYRRLSIGRPIINFYVVYGSRGDSSIVGESVLARARQIETIISNLFSSCSARFKFVGASELVDLHRRSKTFSLNLPFLEHLGTGKDSYVLLVSLKEYWKFVTDDSGQLRRYLFDSNIRDYLGASQVNNDIARSLADATAPDFWWLNNGVTILTTSATVPGKTIHLQDIQIVNGLQTTEAIFRHFQDGGEVSSDRALLVKIIVSSDTQARDRIIRATNNQNTVEIAALHATDRIQRNIEEILQRYDWYYERRKNYIFNIGKPSIRFVTPLYVASSVVALIHKNPFIATSLKSNFMRSQSGYDAVFSEKLPIEVWPVLVIIFKRVEECLHQISSEYSASGKFVSRYRALMSLLVVAKTFRTFSYSVNQILEIDPDLITKSEVSEIWKVAIGNTFQSRKIGLTKLRFYKYCERVAIKYELLSLECVGLWDIPVDPESTLSTKRLPEKFITMVDTLLPSQPWHSGIHAEIASKLDCRLTKVSRAIKQLIEDGRRNAQIDGVVYNTDGSVLTMDSDSTSESDDGLNEITSPYLDKTQ